MKLLFKLMLRAGVVSPPPAGLVYGATADAGQVNSADSVTGNTLFFDGVSGSDLNTTPTTSGTAAQTITRLYDYVATGGSYSAATDSRLTIARGTTYYGCLQLNNSGYGNFLVGTHGTGARPKIYNKESAANNLGGNNAIIFSNKTGHKIRNLSLDGQFVNWYTVNTLTGSFAPGDVVTAPSGATGVFQYAFSGTQYIIEMTNLPTKFAVELLTGPSGTVNISSLFASPPGLAFQASNWEVSNCELKNTTGNGIQIGFNNNAGTADNITVTNNVISACCRVQGNGAGIDGGGSGVSLGTQTSTISYNTVFNCGTAGTTTNHNMYLANMFNTTFQGNWCYMTANYGNHALVMHGVCDTVTIKENLFEKCGNGIGINPGYATTERFDNFVINNNINRQHGTVSGQTQGYFRLLSAIRYAQIYNNLNYGNAYGETLQIGGGAAVTTSTDVVYSHETYYNNCTASALVAAVAIVGNIPGVVIQNSVFMSTAASGFLLDIGAAAVAAGTVVRNCIFYMPNNAGNAIKWNGTNYTIAAWMALYGTANNCQQVDPLFVDAATGDFRLQAGSPAKLAGYNSGITTDFIGNARHATTPSIGAYE